MSLDNLRPLIVDLDGTLIKTDLLFESFLALIAKSPWLGFIALFKILVGKAALKTYIASHVDIRPDLLPYDQEVVDYIETAQVSGRAVYLVSASDQRYVEAVANHLGLFTDSMGSMPGRNLGGVNKANALGGRFGAGQFDYIGDSSKDFPVWASGKQVLIAGIQSRRHASRYPDATIVSERPLQLRAYLKSLRMHQWLKNILVFVPFILDHNFTADTLWLGVSAFLAFSLCASSVYIVNDLFDLNNDRTHVQKKFRPFASGDVPIQHGLLIAPVLLFLSMVVGASVSMPFLAIVVLYFLITLSYSVYLKRIPLLDVMLLAMLYVLRIFAGGVATGDVVSDWFMAFAIFLFLFLATIKRLVELVGSVRSGGELSSGRGFIKEDLTLLSGLSCASGYISILVLALYVTNPQTRDLYQFPEALWGVCLLLLFWVNRMLLVAHRGQMNDDPLIFAITDRVSLTICTFVLAMFFVGIYV